MSQLHNCRVLQHNFRECVTAAQMGNDPDRRPRHDDVELPTPEEPHLDAVL